MRSAPALVDLLALLAAMGTMACKQSTQSSAADAAVIDTVEQRRFGRARELTKPAECRTALLETTSCRGEDSSFQECRYFFRAKGVPRAETCRAFLSSTGSEADASTACNELAPVGWKKVGCADYDLPSDFTCFACSTRHPEESRQLIQAFNAACDNAIVLKGCNVDIAHPTR